MPNRSTHVAIGASVGGSAALYRARHLPAAQAMPEMLGGALAGLVGGALPDGLEPATSPHHRGIGHSVLTGVVLTRAGVAAWETMCRERAESWERCAVVLQPGTQPRANAELKAFAWRVCAGLLVRFVAGYLSHIALDAMTPRSVPLVVP